MSVAKSYLFLFMAAAIGLRPTTQMVVKVGEIYRAGTVNGCDICTFCKYFFHQHVFDVLACVIYGQLCIGYGTVKMVVGLL